MSRLVSCFHLLRAVGRGPVTEPDEERNLFQKGYKVNDCIEDQLAQVIGVSAREPERYRATTRDHGLMMFDLDQTGFGDATGLSSVFPDFQARQNHGSGRGARAG